ncbi:(2Fe-2S)-binding protein [Dermatophilaceae bacterium Soc4.6]
MTSSFDFDGRPVRYRPGQTVGAALVADGTRSWSRSGRTRRPMGLFCGIGVCFECLLTVDGVPDVRACLAPAHEAVAVHSQDGPPSRHPSHPSPTADELAEGAP